MKPNKHVLWAEKYRPSTLDAYIFHDESHKKSFQQMVENKTIPHLLLSGVQGSGKAQPLYSKILTTEGWKCNGDLKKGDTICTPNGTTTKIIDIFPQGKKDIYTITFHDGSSTECCMDHLWECYFIDNYNNRTATKHVVDTRTILEYINKQKLRSSEKFNVSIPLIKPMDTPVKEYEIDPYLLGALLGDGSLCSPTPKLTSVDKELIEECQKTLLDGYRIKPISDTQKEFHLTNEKREIYGGTRGVSENYYTGYFRKTGLYGCRSHEKFIPVEYKSGSISQRWSLVQGLMDTDGTISKTGSSISFTTTSYQLATDLQDIVWSLGCTCTLTPKNKKYKYKDEIFNGRPSFDLNMNHNDGGAQFFRLMRKKERGSSTFAQNHSVGDIVLRRRIKHIEYKSQELAQCILVDDPEHLYITDNYIVTHNTTIAQILTTELGVDPSDTLLINASDENSVDFMRDKIKSFITTFAIGEFKLIQLEEADYLTHNAQAVLRKYMEDPNCPARFILTCNYENKIMPAIKSRSQQFRFKSPDRNEIAEFCATILLKEKIKFNIELLDKYIATGYPDIRKIVNLLQQNSIDGKLQSLVTESESGDYKFKLLDLISCDDWAGARSVACANVATEEWEDLYRFLYENLDKSKKFSKKENWEAGIVVIAEFLYKNAAVADQEINAAGMFIRLSQV